MNWRLEKYLCKGACLLLLFGTLDLPCEESLVYLLYSKRHVPKLSLLPQLTSRQPQDMSKAILGHLAPAELTKARIINWVTHRLCLLL